ncbi:hypothetical protein L6258_03285 [Candidatus Parcubacteria bacterium]|nr:hypothetical protein [Candidatus Parcubacteria bacterium]
MKTVLVVSANRDFVKKVRWAMVAGGHRVESIVGAVLDIETRLRESPPDLIIVGEEGVGMNRAAFISVLRGPGIKYEGPILACDPWPEVRELLKDASADEVSASWRWILPAYRLLGLTVEE